MGIRRGSPARALDRRDWSTTGSAIRCRFVAAYHRCHPPTTNSPTRSGRKAPRGSALRLGCQRGARQGGGASL
eukprot:12919512-Prorocentrum_lima.AAC.1